MVRIKLDLEEGFNDYEEMMSDDLEFEGGEYDSIW